MSFRGKKLVSWNCGSGAFLLLLACALALGLLVNPASAATGGWLANTTGDWDSNANVQVNTPFTISGAGVDVYNNSPTNYYGPSNGYTTAAGGESAYWLNSPNGYTTSGTDPTGAGAMRQGRAKTVGARPGVNVKPRL